MLTDHLHFKTKSGFVFTTRGFYHLMNATRATALYYPNVSGKTLDKEVDEFGNGWLGKIRPDYVSNSPQGRAIFVSNQDIVEVYDPFNQKDNKFDKIKDPIALNLLEFIFKRGINQGDVGLIGSNLVDTGRKPKDVDILIKGINNLQEIKRFFGELLTNIGGTNSPSEEYIGKSVSRYESKYNAKSNDFDEMIKRRWPTVHVPGKFFGKLRFTYKTEEVPEPRAFNVLPENRTLSGKVINDEGTNFMPRTFTIETLEGIKNVLTYFWDYTYCVSNGDNVRITASPCSNGTSLLIHDPKVHGIKFDNLNNGN